MSYSHTIYRSIDDVDADTWRSVCAVANADTSMDPRMIRALEISRQAYSSFWHIVFHDEALRPRACTTVFTLRIDLATLVDRRVAAFLRRLPWPLSRLRYYKALISGLPLSTGESGIAIDPTCDAAEVARLLDAALTEIGNREGVSFIAVKEIAEAQIETTDQLLQFGYGRVPTLLSYVLQPAFASFDAYLECVRSGYRREILRSRKRLTDAGYRVRITNNTEEIIKLYDGQLHRLLEAVAARAEFRLESLPREFFLQFSQRFGEELSLILIESDTGVAGFMWTLETGGKCYPLHIGIDYTVHVHADIYKNLFYAALTQAFEHGVERVELCQTGADFKARLGGSGRPRFAYIKGARQPLALLLKKGMRFIAPVEPAVPNFNVFKTSDPPAG